jgi:1-acyl-sn-glycerol-3-phosphate acyltransferase
MNFKRKNIIYRTIMPLDQLIEYYRNERKYIYENNIPIKGIKWRKRIHKIMFAIIKMKRVLLHQKLTILHDEREDTDKTIIYACTHIGRYDIEMALESIQDTCFLFLGSPGKLYRSLNGVLVYLFGFIGCDTTEKEDRYISKELAIRTLKQGGNILIFPEGAWNITENQVVMKLYTGTIEMAIRSGADIVPIAIEQYEKSFYINIGKNISLDETSDLNKKRKLSDDLRDTLCTLKWEIWEQFPITKRSSLPENMGQIFVEKIMSETANDYTLEEIERDRFHTSL